MTYQEKLDFITKLGWVKVDEWNERSYYGLIYSKGNLGTLIEHNGSWFIAKGHNKYFIENPSNECIVEYTNILKKIAEVIEDVHTSNNKVLLATALYESANDVLFASSIN